MLIIIGHNGLKPENYLPYPPLNFNKNIMSKKKKNLQAKKATHTVSYNAANPTRRIIDALKEKYVFRLNIANQRMEFREIGETLFRNLTDNDLNTVKVNGFTD